MAKVQVRLISLEIDGVDVSDQISKAVVTSNPTASDFQSFEDARNGGARDYALALTIAQDHATGTLLDTIWTGAGTDVTGTYAPYNNETPSATQPHFDFTATVKEPDGDFLGGEADPSPTAIGTIEVVWPMLAKPNKVIA